MVVTERPCVTPLELLLQSAHQPFRHRRARARRLGVAIPQHVADILRHSQPRSGGVEPRDCRPPAARCAGRVLMVRTAVPPLGKPYTVGVGCGFNPYPFLDALG